MPWHNWSDDNFDFGGLYKAERWIVKFYRRATKQNMMTKEKYGTIRYEYTYLWLKNNKQRDKFFNILYRATRKFPDYAGEIVNDIVPYMSDSPKLRYYKGYFEAILWVKHKSQWVTCK